MKKIILASVSGLALMGLAACTDDQGAEGIDTGAPITEEPAMAPAPEPAPAPAPGGPVE